MNIGTEMVERSAPPASDSSTHEIPPTFAHRIQLHSGLHRQNQGHSLRFVPFKTPSNPKPTTAIRDPGINHSDFPELQCPCGAGPCVILISKTAKNPGRKFYTCPLKPGHGACYFFQWQDTKGKTTINVHEAGSRLFVSPQSTSKKRAYSDMVVDRELSFKRLKRVEFGSPVINNPQHSPNFVAVSGPLKRNKVLLIESKEPGEQSNISCPKHYNPLEDASSENDSSVHNSATMNMVMPQAKSWASMIERALKPSLLTSQPEIHHQQTEFWRHISTAGVTSKDPIYQILGWLGHLAFPPSRCLTVPPCVFPFVDHIFGPKHVDVFDIEGSSIVPQDPSVVESGRRFLLSPDQDAQLSDGVLCEPSGLKSPPNMVQGNIITGSILEAFGQAAMHIQNDLLTLLESMDPLDHKSMLKEANSVFDALDCLSVDYRAFLKHVSEFIGCASSLASIEWSISNDISSQELLDQYNCAKQHFDDLSHNHAGVMAAFTASEERLQLLNEEASRVKNMLTQIENELSSCETETRDLETHSVQISKEMLESKQSLEVTSQEAAEVWKLRRRREVEQEAAKAALEKARVQLRQ